jgi:hypothetical protein
MMTLPPDMQKDLARTDEELTAKLKAIVSKNGWPTIPVVGILLLFSAALRKGIAEIENIAFYHQR